MDEELFHICHDGKSIWRAETIKVAFNLWEIGKTYYRTGWVTIEKPLGQIMYIHKSRQSTTRPTAATN